MAPIVHGRYGARVFAGAYNSKASFPTTTDPEPGPMNTSKRLLNERSAHITQG